MACKVKGCNLGIRSLGYCSKHYKQIHRHGKILERTSYDPNEFIFKGAICKILIYDRKGNVKAEAIIDKEDYGKVSKFKWHISEGAAKTDVNRVKLPLASLLMGIESNRKVVVDHINLDKLDNRKENLRACTHQENDCNKLVRKDSVCGFKGVQKHKGTGKWRARIRVEGKNKSLGLYYKIADAAKAYNAAAIKYQGEFAHLNDLEQTGGVPSLYR